MHLGQLLVHFQAVWIDTTEQRKPVKFNAIPYDLPVANVYILTRSAIVSVLSIAPKTSTSNIMVMGPSPRLESCLHGPLVLSVIV